ncbi:MAG TPA: CoA transferase [Candidatus Binataceae bacterium]|nr:CoA transferase [Candidatus Binataceae bacterium]
MGLPLQGIRVIAVEQYGAGPFATQHLADLGVEVIKLENLAEGGDVSRTVGPHFFANGDSLFFEALNRNKRSLAVDLRTPEGGDILRALAARADALFDNLRGDVAERLGLTYSSLCAINPKLVCVHLSAYGRKGERAAWPGYDYLMQAETGFLSLTGEPDSPPTRAGLSVVDLMAGTVAAMALLAAIIEVRAGGRGRDLDVSLFDTALHTLSYVASWYLNAGALTGRQPRSGHPSLVPSQLYRSADGWIFIMCNKEKFFAELARLVDRPQWIEEPRYANFAARLQHRAQFNDELEAILLTRPTAEWLARFAGRVPAAAVKDVRQALESGFVREQERIVESDHPGRGRIRAVASPIRLEGERQPLRPAPDLGQDTQALLTELGYSAQAIDDLRRRGIVR